VQSSDAPDDTVGSKIKGNAVSTGVKLTLLLTFVPRKKVKLQMNPKYKLYSKINSRLGRFLKRILCCM